jgi:hypothetical protein
MRRVQVAKLACNRAAPVLRPAVPDRMPVALLAAFRMIGRVALSLSLPLAAMPTMATGVATSIARGIAACIPTGVAAAWPTATTTTTTAAATTTSTSTAALGMRNGEHCLPANQVDAKRHGCHDERERARRRQGNEAFAKGGRHSIAPCIGSGGYMLIIDQQARQDHNVKS